MIEPAYVQPVLFASGLQTERSDIRCHVAPGTKTIFVFQTAAAVGLDLSKYKEVPAYQPGVAYPTAKGYLVPPDDVPGLRRVRWLEGRWWESFNENQEVSEKGRRAVAVVQRLLRIGGIPLWVADTQESARIEVQRGGTDILLWGKWKIQIKCDYWAGTSEDGKGTGNLFLQTAELNPLKRY